MKLHETFTNIHKQVLRATKQLLSCDLSAPPQELVEKFETWAAAVCDAYDTPGVRVRILPPTMVGYEGGLYMEDQMAIVLTRPSVFCLFHQMRHHVQVHGRSTYSDPEIDAQGWACSLLHQADPATFRRMVYEYAVPGVRLADLDSPLPPHPDLVCEMSEDEVRSFDEIADGFLGDLDPNSELGQLMQQIAEQDK